ncbi:MAG TPA: energy transducer TonB [Myxococcota bacterium]|nr:energy transducer TonB [Myxococcota bacterium]
MLHRLSLAVCSLAALVSGAAPPAPTPSDLEVVRAYRLYGSGQCDAVREQAHAIDFSEGAQRKPFFRLLEAYCAERGGEVATARQLYSSVVANAPRTTQAFGAALGLADLERLERSGLTRADQKQQVEAAWKTPLYQHGGRRPIQRTEPGYPSAMAAARVKGWVMVDFRIARDGSVGDALILDSDPPFVFEAAALAAVRRWTYEPSDKSEPTRATVKLDFDIEQE